MALLTRAAAVGLAGLLAVSPPVLAVAADRPQHVLSEAEAKAGFLYNCAMFVSWPGDVERRELVIGVVGDEHVSAVVREMQGQQVDGRTLRVAPVHAHGRLDHYHILFVSGGDPAAAKAVLRRVGGAAVLTVGESDDFTSEGGVVRLFTDQGRLRFEINMTRVESAGLKVSAKMLGLARIVR